MSDTTNATPSYVSALLKDPSEVEHRPLTIKRTATPIPNLLNQQKNKKNTNQKKKENGDPKPKRAPRVQEKKPKKINIDCSNAPLPELLKDVFEFDSSLLPSTYRQYYKAEKRDLVIYFANTLGGESTSNLMQTCKSLFRELNKPKIWFQRLEGKTSVPQIQFNFICPISSNESEKVEEKGNDNDDDKKKEEEGAENDDKEEEKKEEKVDDEWFASGDDVKYFSVSELTQRESLCRSLIASWRKQFDKTGNVKIEGGFQVFEKPNKRGHKQKKGRRETKKIYRPVRDDVFKSYRFIGMVNDFIKNGSKVKQLNAGEGTSYQVQRVSRGGAIIKFPNVEEANEENTSYSFFRFEDFALELLDEAKKLQDFLKQIEGYLKSKNKPKRNTTTTPPPQNQEGEDGDASDAPPAPVEKKPEPPSFYKVVSSKINKGSLDSEIRFLRDLLEIPGIPNSNLASKFKNEEQEKNKQRKQVRQEDQGMHALLWETVKASVAEEEERDRKKREAEKIEEEAENRRRAEQRRKNEEIQRKENEEKLRKKIEQEKKEKAKKEEEERKEKEEKKKKARARKAKQQASSSKGKDKDSSSGDNKTEEGDDDFVQQASNKKRKRGGESAPFAGSSTRKSQPTSSPTAIAHANPFDVNDMRKVGLPKRRTRQKQVKLERRNDYDDDFGLDDGKEEIEEEEAESEETTPEEVQKEQSGATPSGSVSEKVKEKVEDSFSPGRPKSKKRRIVDNRGKGKGGSKKAKEKKKPKKEVVEDKQPVAESEPVITTAQSSSKDKVEEPKVTKTKRKNVDKKMRKLQKKSKPTTKAWYESTDFQIMMFGILVLISVFLVMEFTNVQIPFLSTTTTPVVDDDAAAVEDDMMG